LARLRLRLPPRLQRELPRLRRLAPPLARWAWYASAALLVLLALTFTLARLWLPGVAERKADIETYLSRTSGHPIRLAQVAAYWDGLYPGLRLHGLEVYAADRPRPAIRLSELRLSVALLPLIWGEVRIKNLVLVRPRLALERLPDARYRIGGFDPVAPDEQAGDEGFVGWLFRQGGLVIEDGELQWFDHRDPQTALHLTHVNLDLRNDGSRHRLGLRATFPSDLCRACSLAADIRGDPFASHEWGGEIYLQAQGLPRLVREQLPDSLRGRFSLELWSDWRAGRARTVEGTVGVTELSLPLPAPLSVREVRAGVRWSGRADGWRLDLSDLALGLRGPAWSAGDARIRHTPGETRIELGQLDLKDVTSLAQTWVQGPESSVPEALRAGLKLWTGFRPEGTLKQLKLLVLGDLKTPQDFAFEAEAINISTPPWASYPGVRGLSGRLKLRAQDGEWVLASDQLVLNMPSIFRAPLALQQASGLFRWSKQSDHWQVTAERLRVANEDIQATGELELRLPQAPDDTPHLKLRADFRDGNGSHAARYYPVHSLSPEVLAWMEWAFGSGRITTGQVIFEGHPRDFPFRAGNGKFELRAHTVDTVYRYLTGWEPIRQGEADVSISGGDVRIIARGRIGALKLDQFVVQTEIDGHGPDHGVRVSGRVSGAVNETLRLLREVKPGAGAWQGYLPDGLQASGEGVLMLALQVPFGARPVSIQGDYQPLAANLSLPALRLGMEAVTGHMQFTETGVNAGVLQARFLGGEARLSAASDPRTGLALEGRGHITAAGLASYLGPQFAPRLSGRAEWQASWLTQAGGQFQAEVDLRELNAMLPPPLNRPKGLWPVKITARTESGAGRAPVIVLGPKGAVSGRLAFVRRPQGWQFYNGRISLGDGDGTGAPRDRGLHLQARMDALDADAWLALLAPDARPVESAGRDGAAAPLPGFVTRVSLDTKSLEMFDRRFGRFALDLARETSGWSGTVTGQALVGQVRLPGTLPGKRIELNLARLSVPDFKPGVTETAADPRRLPALLLRSKSFQFKGRELGEIDFLATPMANGWRIERLNLTRPDAQLALNGSWRILAGRPASDFNVTLTSNNMGKTLDATGFPGQMSDGTVEIKSKLSWPGPPAGLRLANLNGRLELQAKNGRFLQVEQGATGRLFGLLDLSSIGRYLTLDFSTIFGKGFVFDRITGTLNLERGNATTRDLSIKAPSARLTVDGRVGLIAEDFDLTLDVEPSVSDSLTLGSLYFFGPQVAVAVLALQKLLKEPISRGTRVRYAVKGPWGNPVVTKTKHEAAKDTKSEAPKPAPAAGE
jgi:uncharacterized protein (TIGR02099 family)